MTRPTSTRLLRMLSLLQTRRDWPGAVLAERLGISHRTVRRDVDRLRELGYNIHATMGPDGGYRLEAGSQLPPLLLDDDQALAVTIALQVAPGLNDELDDAATRALTTVRQLMPSHLRYRLDALDVTALPAGAVSTSVSPEVLVTVSSAIRAREVLRFDYDGSETRRRAEPHHIVTAHGQWYLVAWDLDRIDWRVFRIDRISPRLPNGPRFVEREVPGGDVRRFVSARFKGAETNAWPCIGTVILQLPASEVRPFAGDGMVRELDDGRCSLESGSWSWMSLAASFGRFDAEMEVVGPPELAAAATRLATRYRTASG